MILLCWLLVFGVNFGIVHDASKAAVYCVAETLIFCIISLLSIALFVCIKNAKNEYLAKKAELDEREMQQIV